MKKSVEELASAYVLDEMKLEARRAFEERLRHDRSLASLVNGLQATLDGVVKALPRHEPPATAWSELEQRIAAEPQGGAAPRPAATADERRSSERALAWRWAALGGVAALLLGGLALALFAELRRPFSSGQPIVIVAALETSHSTSTEMPLNGRSPNPDMRFIQLASLAEQLWSKRNAVGAPSANEAGRGYAVFDPATDQGFIAVQHVPALKPGQHYHLWIVDTAAHALREAGELPLATSTRGLFFFSIDDLKAHDPRAVHFFVTAEEAKSDGSHSPQGPVVLGTNPI